eukprot:scaffold12551_cov32-Prasinocladus_malaysianus.AAC.1
MAHNEHLLKNIKVVGSLSSLSMVLGAPQGAQAALQLELEEARALIPDEPPEEAVQAAEPGPRERERQRRRAAAAAAAGGSSDPNEVVIPASAAGGKRKQKKPVAFMEADDDDLFGDAPGVSNHGRVSLWLAK